MRKDAHHLRNVHKKKAHSVNFILHIVTKCGGEIFCTHPDWPLDPLGLPYNGYFISFPGVVWPGQGIDHPLPSSTKVKDRVSSLWAFTAWLTLSWPARHILPSYKESFQVHWGNSIPLFLHAAIYLEVYLFHWTSQNAFSHETAVYKWYSVQCCFRSICPAGHKRVKVNFTFLPFYIVTKLQGS
jgi:hypothetical protein